MMNNMPAEKLAKLYDDFLAAEKMIEMVKTKAAEAYKSGIFKRKDGNTIIQTPLRKKWAWKEDIEYKNDWFEWKMITPAKARKNKYDITGLTVKKEYHRYEKK